ncbi:MAG: hypothetical protein BAJALOKI3v1_440012 [Promethearchaeota archaeon]|nr:MAG: hypothetical protein BAJALOKI3v1_440012 [Candidatus Lokiarchaeota archaeon]
MKSYMQEQKHKITDNDASFLSTRNKRYVLRIINHYIRKTMLHFEISKWTSYHTFRRTLNTLYKRMGCPKEDRKILFCHKVSDVNFNC